MMRDKFTENDGAEDGTVDGDDTLVVVLAATTTGHCFHRLCYDATARMSHVFIYHRQKSNQIQLINIR